MKERPILFSAPMVRALLDGTKTQTRRVIKDQSIGERFCEMRPEGAYLEWLGEPRCGTGEWDVPEHSGSAKVPYGVVGDRLWVRETFAEHFRFADVAYRADGEEFEDSDGFLWEPKWRPSIHMPRNRSRITLEITEVRVERLQDISEADAIAEGVIHNPLLATNSRESFMHLWNRINGPGSWDANPWVWCISFRRLP